MGLNKTGIETAADLLEAARSGTRVFLKKNLSWGEDIRHWPLIHKER